MAKLRPDSRHHSSTAFLHIPDLPDNTADGPEVTQRGYDTQAPHCHRYGPDNQVASNAAPNCKNAPIPTLKLLIILVLNPE